MKPNPLGGNNESATCSHYDPEVSTGTFFNPYHDQNSSWQWRVPETFSTKKPDQFYCLSETNCSTLLSLRTPVRAALLTISSQHYSSSLQLSLGKLKSFTLGFLAISSSCFHRLLSLAEDCFGLSDICSIGNICVGSLTARNWLSDSKSESRLIGRLETLEKRES